MKFAACSMANTNYWHEASKGQGERSWWEFVYKNGENKIAKLFHITYTKSGKKPHPTPRLAKCDEVRKLLKWKSDRDEESKK